MINMLRNKQRPLHHPRVIHHAPLLREVAHSNTTQTLRLLQTTFLGLTEREAASRLEQVGYNEVTGVRPQPWLLQLLNTFANPFILVLAVLGLVSLVTDVLLAPAHARNWTKVLILSIMILVSCLLRFWQEFRSQRAVQRLKALVQTTVTVLRRDVGISVDTAIDITKESADIILLEKSLLVLSQGIIEGRVVFGNIMKYLKITVSSNFGNVLSVLIASAFLPFLPMLPLQLLVQNLLYDLSQLALPWDTLDHEMLARPRQWKESNFLRFVLCMGPISSIFDITTFLFLWWIFRAQTPAVQSLFQSGWFVEGLLSQTLIVHLIRTQKIPFIQRIASLPVLVLTGGVMLVGMLLPFTSLGTAIGLQALPLAYFPWLIVTLLAYCILTQVVKRSYLKHVHSWL